MLAPAAPEPYCIEEEERETVILARSGEVSGRTVESALLRLLPSAGRRVLKA